MPVSLTTSINDLFNLVSMQAKEKKILINIDLANEVEKAVLMFDDLRIRSVILILVLNAIKFSSEGGKIEI